MERNLISSNWYVIVTAVDKAEISSKGGLQKTTITTKYCFICFFYLMGERFYISQQTDKFSDRGAALKPRVEANRKISSTETQT